MKRGSYQFGCPHPAATFGIDADGDITSHAFYNMVMGDHSVEQMAALLTSAESHSIQEKNLEKTKLELVGF
jgi:hypothetical protein